MHIEQPMCPECGELVKGTVEVLSDMSLLLVGEDGTAEYEGETKIWWDEQKAVLDADGRATLICENGHEWQSYLDHNEGPHLPSV